VSPATTTPWSLVSVRTEAGPQVAVLRHADGVVVAAPPGARGPGLMALMERWEEVAASLAGFDPAQASALDPAPVLLAPLQYPRKLICAGANYRDHLAEMRVEIGEQPPDPFFFLLPPSTTLIGPGEPIPIPDDPSWRVDWEAELAVVIGRRGRAIARADALAFVAGYSAINDISARGRHRRPDPLAPPFEFDWLGSKGADGFCPMGPGVVPAWLIADPQALAVRCWHDDVLEQDGNTRDMLNDVATLIAAISATVTLEPGDVIATGTPAGVGGPRGLALEPGQTVTVEIEGIGRLRNPIAALAPPA
jgi:2-keto-4-pentenoate hydratase/2-oxohepta-3-ene-1,7-dioic acid hydratase in catechol pathway